MSVLRARIPPGVIVLVTAALMWLISRTEPRRFAFAIPLQDFIPAALALAGAAIIVLGVVSFARAGTTVNPLFPDRASSLVTSGVYRISRNPMYLGFLLLLLAWGIWLSNLLAIAAVLLFVVYMNRFQIAPEERALKARFGSEFDAYCSRVRRWL